MTHELPCKHDWQRVPRRVTGNILVVAVVTLALLAVPARGRLNCPAFSSPVLLVPSIARLPRRSKEVVTMLVRPSTSTAAPPPESVSIITGAVSGTPRRVGLNAMARGSRIRRTWSSGRVAGVIRGALGDGEGDGGVDSGGGDGSLFEKDDGEKQQEDSTRDEGDSGTTPMFSLAAVEDELQSRSAAKKLPPGRGVADEAGDGDEGRWLPVFFPPREDGDVVQPLVELPLDGVLLQLFPALLIGAVGLFVTIAVQVEASRFDGMVGGEGGAVVVTDLRDTMTTGQQQQQPPR